LISGQSIYISFLKNYHNTKISRYISNQFPNEITIVLQHQYENLVVFDDKLSVNLSFNNIPETIIVPFSAITKFSDPFMNFNVEFAISDKLKERPVTSIDDTKQYARKTSNIIKFKNTSYKKNK